MYHTLYRSYHISKHITSYIISHIISYSKNRTLSYSCAREVAKQEIRVRVALGYRLKWLLLLECLASLPSGTITHNTRWAIFPLRYNIIRKKIICWVRSFFSFPMWIVNPFCVLLNDFRKPSLSIKLKTFANHEVEKYIVAYCFNRVLFLVSIHDHPWANSKW